MKDISQIMRQAQQMQAKINEAQKKLEAMEVEGSSGGGMVKVTMTGKHDVKRVQIEPAVIGEDREMLEDLIAAAINDAVKKVEQRSSEMMSGLMAGMRLPPGMKLPF